jgi:catechol 2,3-dioxygenase-like lactoylglutathione lyase family enzyme
MDDCPRPVAADAFHGPRSAWHDAAMLTGLDHVILGVRDLPSATRQYATLFGRRPSWRGEHPGEGTANTLFRLGNTYVELLAPEGDGPTARALLARIEAVGEGPVGLAFATDDAEAARTAFAERGLDPGPVEPGLGRDSDSGQFRRWRRVMLPLARTRGVLLFAIEHTTPPEMLPAAEAVGAEQAAVSGIDHAVVRSLDADAAIALYGEALGLRLALDRRFPAWGMRLVFFRVGGVTIELANPLGAGGSGEVGEAADAEVATPDQDRLWGLSWRVPDADAARARLAAAGVDVSDVRKGRKPGTRVLTVRNGTCGVPTLLLEPADRAD